ncbi:MULTISPECIES: DUF6124 family protein [unclassified Pseudomonas]|uniref:DUF6124 family protein n=1 Tax=unclassified Pseudomonas TaxID=196821 RepID=UPI0008761F72|nr:MULTISPECIES: DUF6124 family protein [unclassified Pseudomonas]SCZ38022.1 hypothetical protein SAMN03159405_03886 [Pseudomonas sp. NFACC44-2]SDA88545.1 hypothetical protein SAMN03159429_05396 [Pseudomonas sp. NFACC51]SFI02250.1 hypothetical protein SAMN03159302_03186 [Pseudomonas sp. NFACC54]SFT24262.1 hypothetical protein SAMN03159306_04925 [Pseudomonas sp. NFACC48-1]
MFKVTPNPPESDPTFSYSSLDPEKFHEATERALNYYLKPEQAKPKKEPTADQLFTVVESIDTESLLANLSENLASANAMISDLAFDLEGSRRHVAMGIQQVIEVSELLANRALDIVDPR